jgi:hypothetical protein
VLTVDDSVANFYLMNQHLVSTKHHVKEEPPLIYFIDNRSFLNENTSMYTFTSHFQPHHIDLIYSFTVHSISIRSMVFLCVEKLSY